jgi:PAS domain S-box-containing protein
MRYNQLISQKQLDFISHHFEMVIFEWAYSKEGHMCFKYMSPSAKNMFNNCPRDIRNYLDYIDPSQHKLVSDEHFRCANTKKSFDLELRLLGDNLKTKWIRVYANFTYEDVNGSIFYTGYISDITDQKTNQELIKNQKFFYENIMNEIPLAVFVMNTKKQIIYKNKLFDQLLKIRIENRNLGINSSDKIFTDFYFNELDIHFVFEEKVQKISEEVLVDENHSLLYFLNWLIPVLDIDDQIIQIMGYSLNITNRKIIENQLTANEIKHREIIEKMNLGLIEVNFNGDIIFANDTFLKMTNLMIEDVNKFDIDSLIESIEQTDIFSIRANTWKTQKAKEFYFHLNGDDVCWLLNITTHYDDDRNVSVYLIVCLDITDQKQLEKDLILSKDVAERNSKVKDIFLANMSHEIRTPLNALIGLSNLLTKTNLNETQEKYTKLLKSSADNLLAIVNDVLDLSKINSGNVKVDETPFNIYEVIRNIIKLFTNKADEKGIFLNLEILAAYRDGIIVGDQYKFSQILSNLISNAIKFTEVGGVIITCNYLNEDEFYASFQITISDTGIGIDEHFIDKIYDKFSQENDSTTRIYGGTGLGMSITKELLTILKGTIYVKSEKNIGTDFVIDIPFRKIESSEIKSESKNNETKLDLKGKKILVVDDNDMNRLVASLILNEHGAEIREAENGFDALEILEKENIDLILMDVQMPVMNGYETTRRIRLLGFTNPIIALTAYAVSEEKDRCIEAGMNDLITKPFEELQLITIVKHAVDRILQLSTPKYTINIPIHGRKIIDFSYLKKICKQNRKQFIRMIDLFLSQAKRQMVEMQNAYEDSDVNKIRLIAHQMKPSMQMLGIHKIEQEIKFLESIHSDIGKNSRTEKSIRKIRDVVSEVCQHIEELDLETYEL